MAKKTESTVDLLRVGKGGEVIEIDPSTLNAHKRKGWVEVVGTGPAAVTATVAVPDGLSEEAAKKLLDKAAELLVQEQKEKEAKDKDK